MLVGSGNRIAPAKPALFDAHGRLANAAPDRARYVRPNERIHVFDPTRKPESETAAASIKSAWPNLKVNFWLRTLRRVYWPHGALKAEFSVEVGLWVVGRKHRQQYMPVGPLGLDGYDYFHIVRDAGMVYRPFDMRVVHELHALTTTTAAVEVENEALLRSQRETHRTRRREAIKAMIPAFRAVATDQTTGMLLKGERMALLERLRHKKAAREAALPKPWAL